MNAKEKALEHLNFYHNKGKGGLYRRMKEVIDVAINESKKEVFDDIAKMPLYCVNDGKKIKYIDVGEADWFKELKKRHLSTFQKKSDIIADKSKSAKLDNIQNIVAD